MFDFGDRRFGTVATEAAGSSPEGGIRFDPTLAD
jgi:hypothetical protein